jgi:hypothetical protein
MLPSTFLGLGAREKAFVIAAIEIKIEKTPKPPKK